MGTQIDFFSNAQFDYTEAFPVFNPTLNLDFVNQESVDSRVTTIRTSNSTFVGSNRFIQTTTANQPRIDFDPITGECRGLLIEESRTNYIFRSAEFDAAGWANANVIATSNAETSPDGTVSADKVVETTSTSEHYIEMNVGLTGAQTAICFSGFFKAGEKTHIHLRPVRVGDSRSATVSGTFNLSTGTWFTAPTLALAYGAEPYPDGWYRVWLSFNTESTTTTIAWRGQLLSSTYNGVYTGDGTSGLYMWGAQTELGFFPTSYIPTAGASATRNADSYNITGTQFTDFYNATEGTFYVEGKVQYVGGNNYPTFLSADGVNGQDSYEISIWDAAGLDPSRFVVWVSNAAQAIFAPVGNYTANSNVKIAAAYKQDDFLAIGNGRTDTTDTTGSLPPGITRLRIGENRGGGFGYTNGWIKKVSYYPKRLPLAQLQSLTE